MKIVHIQGADAGGAPCRLEKLLKKHLGYDVVRFQQAHLQLGFDRGREIDEDQVLAECQTADIVHMHTGMITARWTKLLKRDRVRAKLCGTAHGVESMGSIATHVNALGVKMTYTTPNIGPHYPNGTFLPNAIDPVEEGFPDIGKRILERKEHLTLACSRSYMEKHKDYPKRNNFVDRTKCATDFPNELVPNKEWMTRVVAADLVWDHMQGYWGQTTLEGFWLGTIPVVTPFADYREQAKTFFGEYPPFGPDDYEGWVSFADELKDTEFRIKQINLRRSFLARLWSPQIAAGCWKQFYASL